MFSAECFQPNTSRVRGIVSSTRSVSLRRRANIFRLGGAVHFAKFARVGIMWALNRPGPMTEAARICFACVVATAVAASTYYGILWLVAGEPGAPGDEAGQGVE